MPPDNQLQSKEKIVEEIVNAVANALKNKPLQNIYIRIVAILLVFCNAFTVGKAIDGLNAINIPVPKIHSLQPWYSIIWGLAIVWFLVRAIRIRIRQLRITVEDNIAENSPIKGLQSFGFDDRELFSHLQRHVEIEKYSQAIGGNNQFRIGVLTGKSGCGKTSLLRAGLRPALNGNANGNAMVCVVATLSGKDPLENIYEDIQAQYNTAKFDRKDTLAATLNNLEVIRNYGTFILIIDQFEQFFTQNPTFQEREGFIGQLKEIYDNSRQIRVLLAIRFDFVGYLYEIQSSLLYTLSMSNYFDLGKFEPDQVVEIIRYVAKTENVPETEIDENFLHRMIVKDLATDDGMVSAANLQILLWIMKGKAGKKTLSFKESVFKDAGGVSGLLEEFIRQQLSIPNIFNSQHEALYVMLALINLDTNVRAGQLTVAQLRDKLPPGIPTTYLPQVLDWLKSLRLISMVPALPAEPRYELAHERLIEPIRNIENSTGAISRKVTRMVEQRTNEWINSGYQSYYLLRLGELRFIQKNRNVLTWGDNADTKQKYLRQSRNRWRNRVIAIGSAATLALIIFTCWQSLYFKINIQLKSQVEQALFSTSSSSISEPLMAKLLETDSSLAWEVCRHKKSDEVWLLVATIRFKQANDERDLARLFPIMDSIKSNYAKQDLQLQIAEKFSGSGDRRADSLFTVLVQDTDTYHYFSENNFPLQLLSDLLQRKKQPLINEEINNFKSIAAYNLTFKFMLAVKDSLDKYDNPLKHTILSTIISSYQFDSSGDNISEQAQIATLLIKQKDPRGPALLNQLTRYVSESGDPGDQDDDYSEIADGISSLNDPAFFGLAFNILAKVSPANFEDDAVDDWDSLCEKLSVLPYSETKDIYKEAIANARTILSRLYRNTCLAIIAKSVQGNDPALYASISREVLNDLNKNPLSSYSQQLKTQLDDFYIPFDPSPKPPARDSLRKKILEFKPDSNAVTFNFGNDSVKKYSKLFIIRLAYMAGTTTTKGTLGDLATLTNNVVQAGNMEAASGRRIQLSDYAYLYRILDHVDRQDTNFKIDFFRNLTSAISSIGLISPIQESAISEKLSEILGVYNKPVPMIFSDSLFSNLARRRGVEWCADLFISLAKNSSAFLFSHRYYLDQLYTFLLDKKAEEPNRYEYSTQCQEVCLLYCRWGSLNRAYKMLIAALGRSSSESTNDLLKAFQGSEYTICELDLLDSYRHRKNFFTHLIW